MKADRTPVDLPDYDDDGRTPGGMLPPSELLCKPALSWSEFWQGVLGLPSTTAEKIAREPGAPSFFLIGRRRYIRSADAIKWVDLQAKQRPYFPRRNNVANRAGGAG